VNSSGYMSPSTSKANIPFETLYFLADVVFETRQGQQKFVNVLHILIGSLTANSIIDLPS
jgi:hypothetical protein